MKFAGLRGALAPEDEKYGRDVVPGFCQLRVHLDRVEGGQRGDLGKNLPWKVDEELNGRGWHTYDQEKRFGSSIARGRTENNFCEQLFHVRTRNDSVGIK